MRTRTGLERFLAEGPESAGLAAGCKVGLVAHPASVDARLDHAADLLLARSDLRLVRLFGPEHGVRGEAQDMEPVEEASDRATSLPVVSLYGSDPSSLRPRREHLEDLDAIVYDLQDAGSRYYTFIYTMSYVMEAARDVALPVVVLDRPNPIGGMDVEGPVLDPELASFVGRYPLPVRHGMTAGELASFFNSECGIGCDLRVVAMTGWRRGLHYEDTGLPWVLPSPNLPTPDTARVYPGGCLVEGTNLSEGRGTTRPFELVGAPWLDGRALARALRRAPLEGVLFRHASFRPTFQKHAGRTCSGVQVHVADRRRFRPFETFLTLLGEARKVASGSFEWRREAYEFESGRLAIDLLLGRTDLRGRIEAGESVASMRESWREALSRFVDLRSRYLIYPE